MNIHDVDIQAILMCIQTMGFRGHRGAPNEKAYPQQ